MGEDEIVQADIKSIVHVFNVHGRDVFTFGEGAQHAGVIRRQRDPHYSNSLINIMFNK